MGSETILITESLKLLCLSANQVAFHQYHSGIYVFGVSNGGTHGQVIHIPAGNGSEIESCLRNGWREISSVKLVGDLAMREKAKRIFLDIGVRVLGEGDAAIGAKVYFSVSNFRIKIERQEKSTARVRKVFIVDDSGTMRKVLRRTLESHPELKVVGETGRPSLAESLIDECKPDVITLDIHMPEMDGITLLKKLHQKFDIPIVMISSVSKEEGVEILKALELGAVDYIEKPRFDKMDEVSESITEKIIMASDVVIRKQPKVPVIKTGEFTNFSPILIGSSTGGTEALRELLTALPKTIPPILIVQHIPAVFSEALAKRLNDMCPFEVKEAKDGDGVKANRVLIAPGGFHMTVQGSARSSAVRLSDLPNGYRHKPAVDVLFDSAVKAYKGDCTAVILTGMGKDGAEGMKKLKDVGALTVAQDKDSCVVYGMPRAAFEMGAVQKQLPLSQIASFLSRAHGKSKKAA